MRRLTRTVVLGGAGALALAAAFAAGRASAPAAAARSGWEFPGAETGVPGLCAAVAGDRSPAPVGPGIDDLRRVVREELSRIVLEDPGRKSAEAAPVPEAAAPADETEPVPASTPLSPQAEAAAEEALATFEAARARRRFTVGDRDRWNDLVARLPVPARLALEQRLMVAMNRDEIAFDPDSSPLAPGIDR